MKKLMGACNRVFRGEGIKFARFGCIGLGAVAPRKDEKMKRTLTVALLIMAALLITLFGTGASDADGSYIVTEKDGEYYLYIDKVEPSGLLRRAAELSELFCDLSIGISSLEFLDVSAKENLDLPEGVYTLKGSLTLYGGAILTVGENVTLNMSGMTLKFLESRDTGERSDGYMRIKGGRVTLESGMVYAGRTLGVLLDYSATAALNVLGGGISADTATAVKIESGSVSVSGGSVSSASARAIVNRGTLTLLGDAVIDGGKFDISTAVPIRTSRGGENAYRRELSIEYLGEFQKGTMTEILYMSAPEMSELIEVYDKFGAKFELTYFDTSKHSDESRFAAVYLPYTVSYYRASELISTEKYLMGEIITAPASPEREGYLVGGWYATPTFSEPYDFLKAVTSDTSVYLKEELSPPSFRISSLEFTYDKEARRLAFDTLSHPLTGGTYSFEWYKNGVLVSSGDSVRISSISDSGNYFCKVKFSYKTDFVEITTPSVVVNVKKCELQAPTITQKAYTGKVIFSDLYSNEYYSVSEEGGITVGSYPVYLTLADSANYKWQGTDSDTLTVYLSVTPATNEWVSLPNVSDVYEGDAPKVSASSLFGTPTYLFSETENGIYTENLPTRHGVYYMKALVAESENYLALSSPPISFRVIEKLPIGIHLTSPPNKTSYRAFDSFSVDGVSAVVTYNSGETQRVSPLDLKISYQSGDSFRFGDSGVILSYGTASVLVEVSVNKREYDLSGIIFDSKTVTYSGAYQTLTYSGELPVGKDGVPLIATVEGGGCDVGEYTVILRFYTSSTNYKTPTEITASLSVIPMQLDVEWGGSEFVYNGRPQVPTAYATVEDGARIKLAVSGAAANAGASYLATAVPPSENYRLISDTLVFSIARADYDMSAIRLSETEFVYDGELKSVTPIGLPSGITVVGFTDNKATTVGEYSVGLALLYDSENYNPPELPCLTWHITAAEYDISGIVFSNSDFVYDGEIHAPTPFGKMPIGADGIPLEFQVIGGARDVSDGALQVELRFRTESKNYITPPSLFAEVRITAMPITVEWHNTSFTYSGTSRTPTAISDKCAISVSGGMTDAGEYIAVAEAVNQNFSVTNRECSFTIEKAANSWLTPPKAQDIFEGEAPNLSAVAKYGTVSFVFYSDSELTNKVDSPSSHGVYYAVALVPESKNYLALSSEAIRFTVVEVLPVSLEITLIKTKYLAFDKISNSDYSLTVVYNNGNICEIPPEFVEIIYPRGDRLNAGDTAVTFAALGISAETRITVTRRSFDLSGVVVSGSVVEYNGKEQSITITGLPDGLSVEDIVGGEGTAVGVYPYTVLFSYDTVNFEPPETLCGKLVIEKCRLGVPEIELVYSGSILTPPPSELFIFETDGAKDVGEYPLTLRLADAESYVFENGESEVHTSYKIIPKTVGIVIRDTELKKSEELTSADYFIVRGGFADGDVPSLEFFVVDGMIYARSTNPNYEIELTPGKLTRNNRLTKEELRTLFIVILSLFIILLSVYLIIKHHPRLLHAMAAYRFISKSGEAKEPPLLSVGNTPQTPKERELHAPPAPYEYTTPINMDAADSLISDGMAKNLIKRGPAPVKTRGRVKAVVNLGALSRSFAPGDTVDINSMKEKELISKDAGAVKVLADGIIDKPLFIKANAFSISAVKMIALSGGEAIKTPTQRIK